MRAVTPSRLRRSRLVRSLRRTGCWLAVPILLPVGLYAALTLSRSPLGDAVLQHAEDGLVGGTAVLGLVVTDIRVEGRATTDQTTILAALSVARGTPTLAVSPARAKDKLESLPWVRSAVIERRLPGTIYVRLVERKPLAVWQHDGKQQLIDREGGIIAVKDLARFAGLPTVVGADAPSHATVFLDMLATEPDLASRVTAAIRVGDRRWNVRIDDAIDVLLPEDDAAAAWARLADLERTSALLKRDVKTVDMRLPDRLVLTVTPEPAKDAPATKKGRPAAKST